MNFSGESMDQRRAQLAATIARQRSELAEAYHNLYKPIQYTETGLRGFNFLRQNSWLFIAVPSTLKIVSLLFSLRGGKTPKPARARHQAQRMDERPPKGFLGHAAKWGRHGWRAFQFYRRMRRYFL